MRLARLARNTVTPHFTYFFTDFEKKTDCFPQSRSNFDSLNLEESREGGSVESLGDSGKKKSPDFRSPEVGISANLIDLVLH